MSRDAAAVADGPPAPGRNPVEDPVAVAYDALAALGERALVAAGTGDGELLERLLGEWEALAAVLPAAPPAAAGPALTRAAAAHDQLGVLLRAARTDAGDGLARTSTGRRVASGYGARGAAAGAAGVWAEHRA